VISTFPGSRRARRRASGIRVGAVPRVAHGGSHRIRV